MKHLLVHIHGFLSSNDATRVAEIKHHIENNNLNIEVVSPRLPETPQLAVQYLEKLLQEQTPKHQSIALLGHSLGAYFATHIASKYQLKAALVNPVIRGYEIMCEFYGDVYNPHTDESFTIGEKDIEYLISINLDKIARPDLFLVLLQAGDEIVDPVEARTFYQDCRVIWEPDGCHDFSDFERHIEQILGFLFEIN